MHWPKGINMSYKKFIVKCLVNLSSHTYPFVGKNSCKYIFTFLWIPLNIDAWWVKFTNEVICNVPMCFVWLWNTKFKVIFMKFWLSQCMIMATSFHTLISFNNFHSQRVLHATLDQTMYLTFVENFAMHLYFLFHHTCVHF